MAYSLTHTDTCLSCYVLDHCNGDGERLIGVPVTGASTYGEVRDALINELQVYEFPAGFDYDAARDAIELQFQAPSPHAPFAPHIGIPCPNDDNSDGGESVYAYFRLSWDAAPVPAAGYSVANFTADLAEPYAWPGGYPRYFITTDGAALSFKAAADNAELIKASIAERCDDGWRVSACEINWEDVTLTCDHSGERIESAYGNESEAAE